MAKKLEFLGMTEDGRYMYKKENGREFTSKRKLHTDDEPDVIERTHQIINREDIEKTDVDKLSQSFGENMKKGKNINAGETLKEVFKDALLDVSDKTVTEEQVNDQTLKIIAKLEQAGILFQVENNRKLQKNVLLNAEEKLMNEIEVSKNKQYKRLQNATYEANEFAANIYGIDTGRPKWQIALAKQGANVFFMIWFIISTLTFTPIMFFLTMIGVQVKTSSIKWVFTILIYIGFLVLIWCIVAWIAGPEYIPMWPN